MCKKISFNSLMFSQGWAAENDVEKECVRHLLKTWCENQVRYFLLLVNISCLDFQGISIFCSSCAVSHGI